MSSFGIGLKYYGPSIILLLGWAEFQKYHYADRLVHLLISFFTQNKKIL